MNAAQLRTTGAKLIRLVSDPKFAMGDRPSSESPPLSWDGSNTIEVQFLEPISDQKF